MAALFSSSTCTFPSLLFSSATRRPIRYYCANCFRHPAYEPTSTGGYGYGYGYAFDLSATCFPKYLPKRRFTKTIRKASAVAVPSVEEIKEYSLPTWSDFELGRAPVYWKTTNGLPPASGENLTLFYNPAANSLIPNDDYGIAFNGGFNQPIMCGGEPRVMTRKNRGKADNPIFSIKIRVPKHAVSLIFSFTNGVDWDGPYRLQFQLLKMWKNRPLSFFNEISMIENKKLIRDASAVPPSPRDHNLGAMTLYSLFLVPATALLCQGRGLCVGESL